MPIERTAMLMATLLGAPVSTGFVACALQRFAQRLAAAGFDEAMNTALRAEGVLCVDETPTNVIGQDTDAHGEPVTGSPYAVTVCTPDAWLVYYAPIGSRSKTALAGLGVLAGYTGYLVRDDYAGCSNSPPNSLASSKCVARATVAGRIECPRLLTRLLVSGGQHRPPSANNFDLESEGRRFYCSATTCGCWGRVIPSHWLPATNSPTAGGRPCPKTARITKQRCLSGRHPADISRLLRLCGSECPCLQDYNGPVAYTAGPCLF